MELSQDNRTTLADMTERASVKHWQLLPLALHMTTDIRFKAQEFQHQVIQKTHEAVVGSIPGFGNDGKSNILTEGKYNW